MAKKPKLDVVSVRLIKGRPLYSDKPVSNIEDALNIAGEFLKQMDRETFCVMNLNVKNMPINLSVVSIGTLNSVDAAPRDIFKASILSNAAAVILMHNHPSGSIRPSQDDICLTDRLIYAGAVVGIPVLDHVIVGAENSEYYSMRRHQEEYSIDGIGEYPLNFEGIRSIDYDGDEIMKNSKEREEQKKSKKGRAAER